MGWNQGRPPVPRCFFVEIVDFRYLVFLYFATMLAPTAFMAVVYALIYGAINRQVSKFPFSFNVSCSIHHCEI